MVINKIKQGDITKFRDGKPVLDEKGKERQQLFDGGGLVLVRTKAGTCVWHLRFRLGGKEKTYAIGLLSDVDLTKAREARQKARELIKEGVDPTKDRQVRRAEAAASSATTFRDVAEQWFRKNRADWSDIHYQKSLEAFERDVYPVIGKLPIDEITPPIIAGLVDRIVERGAVETASRILQHVNGVFRLARARDLCSDNPAVDVREVLPKKRDVVKRPALLDIEKLRDVLRRADVANLSRAVALAHRLVAFTAQRIGNVTEAEWSQFDLDSDIPTWTIPRIAMKVSKGRDFDHVVYLGPTITAELRAWRDRIGPEGFLFPSPTEGREYITRESLEKVYRVTLSLAKVHSMHGWRAAFSTLAKESRQFNHDAIELSLDHIHDSAVARAYDRGERRPERIRLAQWWDAQLNPPPADVIPIDRARTA